MLSYLSGVNQNNLKNNNMNNQNDELGIYYPNAQMGKIKISLPKVVQTAVNTVQSNVQSAVNTVQSQVQAAIQSTQDALKGINVNKVKHDIAKVYFVLPRGAFLILLRVGGALEKTPVKINLAKEIAKQWASKGTQIKQRWYDFGGDPQELVNIVNMSSAEKTVSGFSYLGAEPVTTTAATGATVATATPILASVLALLGKATDFLNDPKNKGVVDLGKGIASNLSNQMQQKNPAETKAVGEIVSLVNNTLPSITAPVSNTAVTTALNTAGTVITDVKTQLAPPQPTKNNKMLYIIGGVAVVGLGAMFLLKKKK
jgi:hypothetical protein